MPPIIGIQFSPKGKQYHFDTQGITDLVPGDRVVVETARGRQLGIVVDYVSEKELDGRVCKPIERKATPQDLVLQQHWQSKGLHALVTCREEAGKLGLKGYKFVRAEYNFDGSQVTILYATERKKGNLAALQRVMRRSLRSKVELYQIGPRDFAKQLDGLGACGEQRCCSRFLIKFNSVSIRMAKLQNISLTPSEITGLCGRLRCCLAYEQEQYAEAAKGLPKRGKEVVTPYGKGRVVEVRTLAGSIVVEVDRVRHLVQREDIGKTEFTTPPVAEEQWPSWLPEEPQSSAQPAQEKESRPRTAAEQRSRASRRRRKRPKKNAADSQAPKASPGRTAKVERPKPSSEKKSSSSRRRGRRRPRRRNKPGPGQ
jgi:cell fate regulator YaaT (PSP1 superfamily)